MEKNTLEKIGLVLGVLAFFISLTNVYYTHFDGPDLSIVSLPNSNEILHNNVDKDITFNFKIYNDGGKPAFVRRMSIYHVLESGDDTEFMGYDIEPQTNFYILPGDIKEINVTLVTPLSKYTGKIKIEILQESPFKLIESEPLIIEWR
ncbi:hypothetical protein [uncultured Methanolobus sp.]|uniref:hypothetical protein n=1 Tax=uncultured Methanolobus sp. TaxID=218300 RepID=UPI002AAC03EF|nr:hypothetical protein [uncultured Methanolobus sp.]